MYIKGILRVKDIWEATLHSWGSFGPRDLYGIVYMPATMSGWRERRDTPRWHATLLWACVPYPVANHGINSIFPGNKPGKICPLLVPSADRDSPGLQRSQISPGLIVPLSIVLIVRTAGMFRMEFNTGDLWPLSNGTGKWCGTEGKYDWE